MGTASMTSSWPNASRNTDRSKMGRHAAASALVVVTVGTLLHFAWAWSNQSRVVAVFAPINESVWEHLKMAFWPAVGLSFIQRPLYGKPAGWLVPTAVRALLPPALIVMLFYGYTSILGTNLLVLDLATFVVAVVAGEFVGHALMDRPFTRTARNIALVLLLSAAGALSIFTFRPPSGRFFQPSEESHMRVSD